MCYNGGGGEKLKVEVVFVGGMVASSASGGSLDGATTNS